MRKLIIIGIIFSTLISCEYLNQLSSDNSLTEKIETEFKSESEIIDLKNLNEFDWDNLLILGPYSVVDNIEKELNLDLENIRENGIEYDDSINLLVFLKNGKSIKISEVSRRIGDFSNLRNLISKESAKFIKTENGTNVLVENINGKLVKRVGGIPYNAFFAEKENNSNWFLINSIHNHKNNAQISIYDYETGELILNKRFFKICPIDELKLIEDLKREIEFFDGEKIQLKDNCYLQTN
ncbi:hypothetical protein GCM10023314_27830 [Algibacter agarivorans]|uniref:Lipoprotein n=1 Tax=Algibacter agarivorans TaxID=1109741 RepID=A0ABP9GT08_9FLAO